MTFNLSAPPLRKSRARLQVVCASLLWSSSGVFAKEPGFAGWPGPALAFWRALFACVLLVPLIRRPVWSWKLLPLMLSFAAMNLPAASHAQDDPDKNVW